MVEEPPVTWLMPVLNGMPHLPATLDSIFRQTHRRQRLLVWDNGSTDGTLEELRRWIPHRIAGEVLSGTRLNVGASCARLVEAARTELCARIDGDDVNHCERLARQVQFLGRHPEVVAVGSAIRAIDEHGAPFPDHGWNLDYHEDDTDIVHELLVRAALRHPAILFRRSAVLEAGNYASLQPAEDYELLLRLASRGRLANLPEHLLEYRFHRGSVSQNRKDRENFDREVRARWFAKAGEALFGVREDVLLRLKRREHPFALPHLLAIARHLEARRERLGLSRRVLRPSFLDSVRHLVAPGDRLTRLAVVGARRLVRA